jgi:hypothetical protein
MHLDLLASAYSIARLRPTAAIPEWAQGSDLLSITRTPAELSIVCGNVPEGVPCQRDWRCLRVRGPLDFSLTGVLASLAMPLAEAGVPIFVISTFDTDYILVPRAHVDRASAALFQSGHTIDRV